MKDVAIINYGLGNISSVANACEAVGSSYSIATSPEELKLAKRLILPGVGAFGDGMRLLREGNWLPSLQHEVREKGKPILGVCLGMQLLATKGYEYGTHQGIGWIEGEVIRIAHSSAQERIPHIGWNDVSPVNSDGLYAGIAEKPTFYFVHSYVLQAADESRVTAWCQHGGRWSASVQAGNIFGVQFHPEKSQHEGLKLLKNFLCTPCLGDHA